MISYGKRERKINWSLIHAARSLIYSVFIHSGLCTHYVHQAHVFLRGRSRTLTSRLVLNTSSLLEYIWLHSVVCDVLSMFPVNFAKVFSRGNDFNVLSFYQKHSKSLAEKNQNNLLKYFYLKVFIFTIYRDFWEML